MWRLGCRGSLKAELAAFPHAEIGVLTSHGAAMVSKLEGAGALTSMGPHWVRHADREVCTARGACECVRVATAPGHLPLAVRANCRDRPRLLSPRSCQDAWDVCPGVGIVTGAADLLHAVHPCRMNPASFISARRAATARRSAILTACRCRRSIFLHTRRISVIRTSSALPGALRAGE